MLDPVSLVSGHQKIATHLVLQSVELIDHIVVSFRLLVQLPAVNGTVHYLEPALGGDYLKENRYRSKFEKADENDGVDEHNNSKWTKMLIKFCR